MGLQNLYREAVGYKGIVYGRGFTWCHLPHPSLRWRGLVCKYAMNLEWYARTPDPHPERGRGVASEMRCGVLGVKHTAVSLSPEVNIALYSSH
jgi:hypothetical protein